MSRFGPIVHKTTDEAVAAQIVAYARQTDCVAELCDLIDYDTAVGAVEPYWVPKLHILLVCVNILSLNGINVEVLQ